MLSPRMISAKKITPQERKAMERAGKKHKNKKKLWVSVNDKGTKTKRGGWAGNATFQWQGDDTKHAEEIPLRTGDHLKLQGKELWVHPKKGEPFQYAGKKDEDEKKAPEEEKPAADEEAPADDEEAPDEEDFFAKEEANDEEAAKKKKQKPKKKPKPSDEEDDDEEDNFDDEEGAGALTDEEIAADDEEEAIAAEEEKLKLRKTALKADKVARSAKRKADAARDALAQKGIGTKLKTQVDDEGVDQVAADLADKVMKLAGKQSLGSFVKSLLFLGLGIKSGGESVKQLGPALRAQLATKRKELEAKKKDQDEDVIDAEFSVIDNLKALDNPKLLTSGPLAPAEDADIDSIAELQKKHGIGLADAKLMHERLVKKKKDDEAAAAARAAKPPPLPKKKKKEEELPMAKDEDVVAASLRRVKAALKNVKAATASPSVEEVRSLLSSIKAPKGTGWSGGSRSDKLLRDFGEQKNSRGLPMLFAESTLDADRTEDLVTKRLEDAFGPGLFSVEGGDYSVGVQFLYDPGAAGKAEEATPDASAFLDEVKKGSTLSKIWKRLTDADVKKLKLPANMVGTSFEMTAAPSGAVYLWDGSKLFALLGDEILFGRFDHKPWPTDVIYLAEWDSSHGRKTGQPGGIASVRPILVKNRMKPIHRKKNPDTGDIYLQEADV